MKKRLVCLLLALCLTLSCWGCETIPGPDSTTGTVPGETTEAGGPVTVPTVPEGAPKPETERINTAPETFPNPTENIMATNLFFYGAPASGSNGYYAGNQVLRYTDMDTGKTVVLCPQSGCAHADETCQAWIGPEVAYLCDYHGAIYAVVKDVYDCYTFLSKDPATGERKVLDRWESSDENQYYSFVTLWNFSDGRCAIYTQLVHILPGEGTQYEDHTYIYDLVSGGREELPQKYTGSAWWVEGIYGDSVLFSHRSTRLTREEYEAYLLGGADSTGVTYEEYLANYIPAQLLLYNLKTGETEVIATEEQGLIFSGDPSVRYGYTFVYQKGNDILLYDLQTRQERVVATMERVINFWIQDHKVFLIQSFTDDPNGGCYIYFMDMEGGPLYWLPNGGATDYMKFTALMEGRSFFVGNYNQSMHIISKADFYAERYDRSRTGGF